LEEALDLSSERTLNDDDTEISRGNTVVITLNSTQFRTVYNRPTHSMATALRNCLVTVKLPVCLTTSRERHV